MAQTISIVMVGQFPFPPYQSVYWTVYGEPDNTGAQSGYGAGYLLNVGVDSVSQDGAAVDPITLAVGGDLTGNLPDPYVSGIQGKGVSTTPPVGNQVLVFNQTQNIWVPTTLAIPSTEVGGDLDGTLPDPIVVGIQGVPVSTASPILNEVLVFNGTNWIPGSLSPIVGGDLSGTTGDATVIGLNGVGIENIVPTTGDVLAFDGARWNPTAPGIPVGTVATDIATPQTISKRDAQGKFQLSSDANTSHVTYGGEITVNPLATFSISQETQISNVATKDLSFTSQAPFASATLTNRLPGNINFNIPAAVGALATTNSGTANFSWNGETIIQFYQQFPDQTAVINFPDFGDIYECLSVNSSQTLTCNAAQNLNLFGTPIVLLSTGDITADCDNDMIFTAQNDLSIIANNNVILKGSGGTIIQKDAIGVVSTIPQATIKNATAAIAGTQQATFLKFSGHGWATAAGGSSQEVAHYIESLPIQDGTNPTGQLRFLYQINGGAVNTGFFHDSSDANLGNSLQASTFAMITGGNGYRFNDSNNRGGMDLNGSSELRLKSYNTKAFVVETGADSGGSGGVERFRIEGAGTISLSTSSTITYSKNGTSAKFDNLDPVGVCSTAWVAAITSIGETWAQRTSGAGGTWSVTGQQGFAGSVGGDIKFTTGLGGTPGTNLAGNFIIELGQEVSGGSALVKYTSAGVNIATSQASGGGYWYTVTGAATSGMYLSTSSMYIEGTSSLTFSSTTKAFQLYGAGVLGTTITADSSGACSYVPVATATSFSIKQGKRTGNGVSASVDTTYSAQDGRGVISGTNNSGGNLILSSGAVGTGGSGGSNGTISIAAGATEAIKIGGAGELGFYSGSTPVAKQTVSGLLTDLTASGALKSVLTALANLGLIVDSST